MVVPAIMKKTQNAGKTALPGVLIGGIVLAGASDEGRRALRLVGFHFFTGLNDGVAGLVQITTGILLHALPGVAASGSQQRKGQQSCRDDRFGK